jgi:thiol:disulfide interchange protein
MSSRRRAEAKSRNAVNGAFVGGTLGALIAGPWGAAIGAAICGQNEYDRNPDD